MPTETTLEMVEELEAQGSIVECPRCGALNAYAWCYATVDPNTGELEPGEAIRIYQIPTTSAWEWECGKCRTHFADAVSPLTAECYTHDAVEVEPA